MNSRLRSLMLLQRPWPPSSAIPPLIKSSKPIEEENTPYYHTDHFYPARLGEILGGRYQIATKLGYGSGSTVWLARDLRRLLWQNERYVAIKIKTVKETAKKDDNMSELDILRRIKEINPQHVGSRYVRKLTDAFTVSSATGRSHSCLVFEPLRESLGLFCNRFTDNVIPPEILKLILQMFLQGLDYLHSYCHIIHTDLKPDNVMVKIEDSKVLARAALEEYSYPLPQKHKDGRIIYLSCNDFGQPNPPNGVIQITDFDLSESGDTPHSGAIQVEVYRAPEAILDFGYTYSADIWSLGVMIWDLLEGRILFEQENARHNDEYDEQLHLAQITGLLGPVPPKLRSGRRASEFYGPEGALNNPKLIPKAFTFENQISTLNGKEKELFIEFVQRMVKWNPEERSTAKELLDDPWLHSSD